MAAQPSHLARVPHVNDAKEEQRKKIQAVFFEGADGPMQKQFGTKKLIQKWPKIGHKTVMPSAQTHPQGLFLVQNGGSEKPLAKAVKIVPKIREAFVM